MAYDEELAERLREQLSGLAGVTEKKMFGGLAFLIGGNMAVAASGQGGLLLRCDPAETDKHVTSAGVARFEMRGREMDGWLRVDAAATRTARQLGKWVGVGVRYAGSLPPK
jgi:TfoX/Sxy family transcriptional regulator of competence genes